MAKLMRCKACGFTTLESQIKHVCDACGMPKAVFEEYKETISAKRKRILDLHLHPIAVHFPQAIASLIPLLILAGLVLDQRLAAELLTTVKVLVVPLPFFVLGACFVGLIDGKTRFKKLATPLLIRKIVLSVVLLVLSTVMCILVLVSGLESGIRFVVLVLSLGCIGCEMLLGNIGAKLMYAQLKG
ncbi:rubrerythrin [Candidatus Eisenbacteria bacterium]|uniref:Rubrerythrin n=1 Tax=Eiseniibacteriota bacterium TaxID=2212470 RepID=A0ABV6YJ01_UNCEI